MPDRRTKAITLHAPGTETAGGQTSPFHVGRFAEGLLFVEVDGVSGSDPTLDLDVECGPADDDLAYLHTEPPRITGTGKTLVKLANIGEWLRLSWEMGGGNPSFTFGAKLVLKT